MIRIAALLAVLSVGAQEPDGFRINGTLVPLDRRFADIPQCRRVTIDVKDRPAGEVLQAVALRAGFPLEWKGAEDQKITLSAEGAPFLAVVAEICRTLKCNFEEFQSPSGRFLQIPATFFKAPVRAWQLRGPFLLVWYGLTGQEKESRRYAIGLAADPKSHARAGIDGPARDLPVTFAVGDKTLALKSDHDPRVFSSTGPTWEFAPRAELAGEKATIEITLPFRAPTALASATLVLSQGEAVTVGEATVAIERFASGRQKDLDPADPSKEIELEQYDVVLKLRHVDAAIAERVAAEGRQPTEDEQRRIRNLQEGEGALEAHEAWIVGAKELLLPARIKTASGVSSPFDGYRYEIVARSTDLKFEPKALQAKWAAGYRRFEAAFKIEGVSLK